MKCLKDSSILVLGFSVTKLPKQWSNHIKFIFIIYHFIGKPDSNTTIAMKLSGHWEHWGWGFIQIS